MRKYRVNNIPDNFLVDDAIRDKINETIYRIENAIHVENNVQSAYDDFCILIQDEMDNKLPRTKQKPITTTVVNQDISPIGMTFCKTSGTKYVHSKKCG